MSVMSILSGDWEILFDDEKNQNGGANAVAGMRTVKRAADAGPTVYTTNQLYSAIAEVTDDFIAMGFRNPMLPTTPNAYTMESKYFIPRSSTEYLKEGAITASWALSASPDANGNGVLKVGYTGGTNFVANDIGRQVIQADTGDSGTLLDFDVDPDGSLVAWIRPDDSTPTTGDVFDGTGSLTVVADGGTGASTSSSAGVSGETIYAAIQAIGSVPSAAEVYLYQDRNKITDSTGGFQWWTTDAAVSLGIISVLIRIKDMGTLVADGDVEVFARRYTSLYDNFRLNVSAGGFSALPLASAPDINNTTGYRTTGTLTGVSGTWTVGNGVYQGSTWATATARGVITETNSNTELEYYLVGNLTDLASSTAIKEYDFATQADGDAEATTGTVGINDGGPTDVDSGEGGSVTITLGHVDVDHTGDSVTEPYSIKVDCQSNVPIAKVYERIKYVTRRGGDEADLFGSGANVPGESYRGLDGIFEWDANTGTMTEGDDILTTTGGSTWTARLMGYSSETTPDYITVTDQQTSLDAIADNNVIEDESGDNVTIHAGGSVGIKSIASPKSSPLGTFTGTQIFGARGVVYINPHTNDTQAYILTDDFGNLNNPPNTIALTVTNTTAGDRILVARDTGVAGIIDKDQFGGLATPAAAYNGLSDLILRVAGSIDSEVPQAGWVRVVDNTNRQEHRYVYTSRTTGSSGEFTLRNVEEGTGVTSASTTHLIDTTADFQNATNPVEIGMLVRNLTVTKTKHVWEVTAVNSGTDLTVNPLYGPLDATQDWDLTDTYEINHLIGDHTVPGDYAATDDLYDLIVDREAASTSVNNSFIKTLSSNFGVVVNARKGKTILPFTMNATQSDGSLTVTVVRQPDNIAV